jgi:Xaa-Pro aminopeptidase
MNEINRRYITGFDSSSGVVIVFQNGKAYFLIDFRYYEAAKKEVTALEVIEVKDFYPQLKDLLKANNVKEIALEADCVSLSTLKLYQDKLPEYSYNTEKTLSKNLSDMRAIKSSAELEAIKTAQEIAEKAFSYILNYIKAGKTEREIALELDFFMLKNGAEAVSFDTIVLAGGEASVPHGKPSAREVKSGQLVLMDFGAVVNGYHSDMTRTIAVGEISSDILQAYETVLSASNAAFSVLKAGANCKEVDLTAREVIETAHNGIYKDAFGHSLGHGVGLEVHEMPTLSKKSEDVLKSGMVVTIEPGIYIKGKFGVRTENMVLITDDGFEKLTNVTRHLIRL